MDRDTDPYGFLFAHFREDREGHAEKVFLSLSRDAEPLRWDPLRGGQPALESSIGTTGVRDPAIVRDEQGRFHVLATDLRVWGDGEPRWEEWARHGSRSLIVWDSEDLITWEGPRSVEVAPPGAGMAWAPETTVDPATGEHLVFWSSRLYADDDPDHTGASYSRILCARTRDYHHFGPAEVMIDAHRDIIDTALIHEHGRVYRFSKDENREADTWGVYAEVGSSLFADDFTVLATRLGGEELLGGVEAPIIVRSPVRERWYLYLDQYKRWPQGYFVLQTDDLDSGEWQPVPTEEVRIAESTKHGTVLALTRGEWLRLRALTDPAG